MTTDGNAISDVHRLQCKVGVSDGLGLLPRRQNGMTQFSWLNSKEASGEPFITEPVVKFLTLF